MKKDKPSKPHWSEINTSGYQGFLSMEEGKRIGVSVSRMAKEIQFLTK